MGDIPVISHDTLYTSRNDDYYLGRGAFSHVYRCYHNSLGDVAIKILNTAGNAVQSFGREGKVHFKASVSPYILRLLGIAQSKDFVGLVLEYMPNGNLGNLIVTKSDIDVPWTFRLRALSETAAAMAYLHKFAEDKKVIHCDLKAENVLLNSDLHVKIADFGGARFQTITGTTLETTSVAGQKDLVQYTPSYAAPELMENLFGKRTAEMDVYSFGILIYVVVTRFFPFSGKSESMIMLGVKQGQRPTVGLDDVERDLNGKNDVENKNILSLLCHIMKLCWKQNPRDRLPMNKVRDSFQTKLSNIGEERISQDVFSLKQKLPKVTFGGMPKDPVDVRQKYIQIFRADQPSVEVVRPRATPQAPPREQSPAPIPRSVAVNEPRRTPYNASVSPVESAQERPRRSHSGGQLQAAHSSVELIARSLSHTSVTDHENQAVPLSPVSRGILEIEKSFSDPYLREGNEVRMITDLAAIKNAQVGHGGWLDSLMGLRGVQGNVRKVEDNGDVIVSFSGVRSHRFNPVSLVKLPSDDGLNVGDFVIISVEVELVKVLQEDHGGWVDDMRRCFKHLGLLFRFLPNRDVLVVYKDGRYFRFNPLVLSKSSDKEEFSNLRLPENPDIRVGDYCYHDLEDEVMKDMQNSYGGWNEAMSDVRGKVGKFVYVDYHGRAFVAYSSKLCFMLNPCVINKLSKQEAGRRYENYKEEAKRMAEARKAQMQVRSYHYGEGDRVRVHLPLDILIVLQKGHGGWCYRMLEVYGLIGIVKGFDELENTQVLFDTGNKWTFNSAALEPVRDGAKPNVSYVPPFHIGDKVRVNLEEINNLSLNEIEHAMKMFDIPEEKVALLKKTGEVLGIDDDMDVIVSFGDEKRYGLKPEQLKKI